MMSVRFWVFPVPAKRLNPFALRTRSSFHILAISYTSDLRLLLCMSTESAAAHSFVSSIFADDYRTESIFLKKCFPFCLYPLVQFMVEIKFILTL